MNKIKNFIHSSERKGLSRIRLTACLLAVSTVLASLGLHTVFSAESVADSYISASVTHSLSSYAVGSQPDFASIADLGWRTGTTAATAIISRGGAAVGSANKLVFNSAAAEGQGPYNGTPQLTLKTDITVSSATKTFMMYIKTPDIGTDSPDAWPPRDWSVSFDAIQIKQTSTGKSGLRAHAWNSGFADFNIEYLDIGASAWSSFAMDSNGRIILPGGFEGYIKIDMSNCSLFNTWISEGLDPNADFTVDELAFVFGWVGGEYGAFEIGAFYNVTEDNDSLMLKLDTESAPSSMTASADYISASLKDTTGELAVGAAVSSELVNITDLGWRTGTTAAAATVGEASTPIADNKSIVITSETAEGEAPNNATPCVSFAPYVKINPVNNALMLYVETPTYSSSTNWAVRVKGLSYLQDGVPDWFYSNFDNAEYSYLAADGDKWKNGVSDGNGTLFLPSGFKGYVKLYLDSPDSWYSATAFDRNKEYQVNTVDFVFNGIGGDYGPFVIGGAYTVTRDCSATEISLDGGEVKSMTVYADCMEAKTRYDFKANNIGDSVGIVSIQDRGWRAGTTQATALMGESVSILTENKSVSISSPVAEGEGPNNATPYVSLWPWTKIHADNNAVMLYVEAPKYSETSNTKWSLRITGLTFRQDNIVNGWFYSTFNSTQYAYLEASSNAWVRATSDSNGTLTLPNGFKGYIKLYFDSCPGYSTWSSSVGFDAESDYQLNAVDFVFGWLGGDYGSLEIGDIYEVTRDSDSVMIKLDGGDMREMTNYTALNEAMLSEFTEIVAGIGDIDLADAAAVDRCAVILSKLAEEYLERLDEEDIATYNAAAQAVQGYRPDYLGVTIKTPDSDSQAMKFGAETDLTEANREGYTVKGYGMVFLSEAMYDGESVINLDTSGVTAVSGTLLEQKTNYLSFTSVYPVADVSDYGKQIIARLYVTYYNSSTGEEFTVWNGSYEFSDGSTEQYLKCSLADAADYFGVSVFAD